MFTGWKKVPLKHQGSTRSDYPVLSAATKKATRNKAILFYEKGFFGLVWFEKGVRKVRDLKRW